jgi:hypothetical protein
MFDYLMCVYVCIIIYVFVECVINYCIMQKIFKFFIIKNPHFYIYAYRLLFFSFLVLCVIFKTIIKHSGKNNLFCFML